MLSSVPFGSLISSFHKRVGSIIGCPKSPLKQGPKPLHPMRPHGGGPTVSVLAGTGGNHYLQKSLHNFGFREVVETQVLPVENEGMRALETTEDPLDRVVMPLVSREREKWRTNCGTVSLLFHIMLKI